MGWWSKDIMGGDSPLDVEDAIYDICKVEKFPDEGDTGVITPKRFEKHWDEIIKFVRGEENNSYYDEHAIAFQVLGVMMMRVGAPISDDLKKEIIAASQTDAWAYDPEHGDEERKAIVDGFHKAIEAYDGTPIVIKSRGLFEVIADRMSKGKTGLVNVGKNISNEEE